MFFAAVAVRASSVALYFFPIYTHAKEFKLPPEVKKCMSGKSCFQIKKPDPELFKQITAMVKKGAGIYRKIGWI